MTKDYAGTPFQFKIGPKAFVMQELGFADAARVTGIGVELQNDPDKAVAAIHDLVQAKSDKRTADAVMGLPPRKVLELLRDWAGLTPGESETSGDA